MWVTAEGGTAAPPGQTRYRKKEYIWIPYDLPGKHADAQRDAYLREQGITVLRYSNSDVDRNFESVCTDILVHLTNI
ncbi:MAG: DUF559 domain-containing protein [Oscillospiraceae bacterium]|nr:DUF559 domain-containing protein [Oscillospiraceae bacterium]